MRLVRRFARRLAWFAATTFAAAALAPAAAPADSAGPVWSIHRPGGGTVYLAGSVHVLAAAAYVSAHGRIEGDGSLRTLLGAARFARVDAEARALGLPLDSVAQLEPWAVALALTQLQLTKLGLDPAQGVEQQLTTRAGADGKPIEGLETLEEQLGMLDGLSYPDQARFLELTADEAETIATELDAMLAAWRRADTRALERLLLAEYERLPALYRPLVTDRNRRWLPRIEALLARSDDTLVVVGAMHLVGPDGLLALLARHGLAPQPVAAGSEDPAVRPQ